MNAIESRFFNAIEELSVQGVSASVHSEEWEMKIGEYAFTTEIDRSEGYIIYEIIMYFPSLPKEIQKQSFSLFVEPQGKIASYSADFVFNVEGIFGSLLKLAIEIDGHDWHEKTKEQAAYDKRRDREITKNGHVVLRFTGSEIYTNAKKCICEIFDIATSLVFEKYYESGMYFYEQEKEIFGVE